MKDYKISVKHFLNTNVKPSIINGEKYYPIFLLITARRKTTKFKSLIFTELYTEETFNEIMTSKDAEDKEMISEELTTMQNIAGLVMSELNEFDTTFFYAFVRFSAVTDIWEPEIQIIEENDKKFNIYSDNPEYNFLGFNISHVFIEIAEKKGIKRNATLFEFFGKLGQNTIKKYLKNKNLKFNNLDTLNDINKILFYFSLEYFYYFVEGSVKTNKLPKIYYFLFDNYKEIISGYLSEKYSPE